MSAAAKQTYADKLERDAEVAKAEAEAAERVRARDLAAKQARAKQLQADSDKANAEAEASSSRSVWWLSANHLTGSSRSGGTGLSRGLCQAAAY